MEPKDQELFLLKRGAWNERAPYVLVSHEGKCFRQQLTRKTRDTDLHEGVGTLVDDKLRLCKNSAEARVGLLG